MLRAVSIWLGWWSNELAAVIRGKPHKISEALLAEAGRAVEIAV